MGKINVVKTCALPKLIYPFSTPNNPPQTVLNKVTKMIFNLIWDGKPDKIERSQLVQSYEDGGLKLTDVNYFLNALNVSWVNRYLDPENKGKWKPFFNETLNKPGNKFVFKGKLYIKDIDAWVPRCSFLYELLKAWCVINKNFHPKKCKIGKTTFWNYTEVKINNKVILYKDWLEK